MNDKRVTICLREEIYLALKKRAEKENLSLNALVNIALNEHIEKRYKSAIEAKEDAQRWYKHTLDVKKRTQND